MKNKLVGILLLSTLFMSMTSIALVGAESSGKVVIHLKGALEADDNLKAAMEDYSFVDWSVVLGDLTASDLSEADMLVMIQADPAVEYTEAELSALTAWFDEGSKLLWVASDSDYPDGQELRPPQANAALEAVGSKLRGEGGETQDPLVNFDAAYRVKGVSENCAPEYQFLVAGVTYAQFHGCGVIIGTSDAPFSHYSPMYKPELQKPSRYNLTSGNPQQGDTLFGNILDLAVRNAMGATVSMLEDGVAGLEEDVADLEVDIAALNAEKTSLEGDVSTLTSEKASLETDLAAAQSSASTMQLAAVAALIIGVVVGYFVGPMLKKQ